MEKLGVHIAILVLCLSTWCAVASDRKWYKGCYKDNSRPEVPVGDNTKIWGLPWGTRNETDQDNCLVVECCRKCFLQRFEFAAIQEDRCHCHSNKDDLRMLNNDFCLSENRTEHSYLPLHCGQTNVSWSVFRSSGPYIVNISVTMDTPWVVTGRPVVIEVVTNLASFVNISDEIPSSLDVSEMLMEWSFDDLLTPGSLRLKAEGREVYGRISHTFNTAGNNSFRGHFSGFLKQDVKSMPRNLKNPVIINQRAFCSILLYQDGPL
ncbi:uncharacterized protein LOC132565563 [Ylistrum balloti]|uniref:uncharacterized protein LOC132565563 n=1 Tax=Ylistrum balloti TaxID=509963 RepID=UPI002905A1F6|nr:uncharacterized protein LOC132565563 [Ylistrum balloti]